MRGLIAMVYCSLLWAGSVQANSPPVVSNVQAKQRSGTKLVDLTYDVLDPDGDAMTVAVQISDDDGQSFGVPARTFTGDVGSGIKSGKGKRIVWDAEKDVPKAHGVNYRPKVVADDGTGGGVSGGLTAEFVWIQPGTFTMGSPSSESGRFNDEGPQHQVTISKGFYLGKTEITQGQWEAVMGTKPWSGLDYVQESPNNPAVYISWSGVQAFIHRLNVAVGDSLYRLPTEAEWEYACRARATTVWSFGSSESQLKDYGWYDANAWNVGEQYAHAVGTKQPNPWGLFDMHGNVWEWCQDWYGAYSSGAQTDPKGPASGSARVDRGGGFISNAAITRSADRNGNDPDDRIIIIGARLLRVK